jgi:hypothetical protein
MNITQNDNWEWQPSIQLWLTCYNFLLGICRDCLVRPSWLGQFGRPLATFGNSWANKLFSLRWSYMLRVTASAVIQMQSLQFGPQPLPKPSFFRVQNIASFFDLQYPVLLLRSCNSCLRRLRFHVTSIHSCT